MRSRAAISYALLILLILAPVGTGIAVATADSPGGGAAPDSTDVSPATHDADPGQVIRINVTADGDARWTIEFREHLHDENETEAFRETIDAVVSGQERPPLTEDDIRSFVDESENATGREMAIRDTEYTGRIDNDTGVIAFHFTWTNFAEVENDGGRLIVGDAFNGTSGRWLPTLSEDQRLIIDAPDGYYASTAPRAHESGTFEWNGPYEFTAEDRPIVYSAQNPDTTTLFDETDDPLPMALIGVGVFTLVIAVGTGGYLLARRQTADDGGIIAGTVANDAESGTDESDPADGATPVPPGDAATGDETADDAVEEDEIDETLLSDEERVMRLLKANGGRMKQANIVKETGWSNAKVSQLLSSMDDNDQVDKLRIGRENLITLPDEDVGDLN